MSIINGFKAFGQNQPGFVHNQIDTDEFYAEKDRQKGKKRDSWNLDEASAVYEPSQTQTKNVTYEKPSVAVTKTDTASASTVELSDAAKSLLEELKEKYGNCDFIIANYSSDEEADELMSHGTKEYSVLIEPELLEKMAADEATKEQVMGQIDTAMDQMNQMLEDLGDDAENVESIGVSFKADGTITYFAKMIEDSEAKNKELQEDLKEKRAEKKEHEKELEEERVKKRDESDEDKDQPQKADNYITATSIEDLLAQIREKSSAMSKVEVETTAEATDN